MTRAAGQFVRGPRVATVLAATWLLSVGTAAPQNAPRMEAGQRITALLTPRTQAVLSAEVTGRVVKLERELGEAFAGGDVLVRLDELSYRANRQIAEANLTAARRELERVQKLAADRTRQRHTQAVLAAARANLAATERLHQDGHASQVDLENARRDVVTAEVECELAESTTARDVTQAERELVLAEGKLQIARSELEGCALAAPYAGRVARVLVHEHELVERGRPLIEIVDDTVLRAKFLLPSRLFRAVPVGKVLTLNVVETGETVSMQVSHVAAVLDAASATFEVYAEVDNRDGRLRAGMNGWLALPEGEGR